MKEKSVAEAFEAYCKSPYTHSMLKDNVARQLFYAGFLAGQDHMIQLTNRIAKEHLLETTTKMKEE